MIRPDAELLLDITDLHASVEDQPILKGVNLQVRSGEIHAVMGRNGSGKSTLSKVLAGHPAYSVTSGMVRYRGENLFELEAEERARLGVFLGFQYPVEIPGVSNLEFLRVATNARRLKQNLDALDTFDFEAHVHERFGNTVYMMVMIAYLTNTCFSLVPFDGYLEMKSSRSDLTLVNN